MEIKVKDNVKGVQFSRSYNKFQSFPENKIFFLFRKQLLQILQFEEVRNRFKIQKYRDKLTFGQVK